MKKTLILSAFVVTSLLLGGCSQQNTNRAENSSMSDPAMPSTPAPIAHAAEQPQSQTAQNEENGNAMISEEEAQNIALSHAGLTSEQVNFVKSTLDSDDGRSYYDVEFYTENGTEYDYEIDPYSGKILDNDFDVESIFD